MVGWVKVAQREGGSSPTADCACGGLCSLEVNPATEDPPHHHVGSTHPTSVNHPDQAIFDKAKALNSTVSLFVYRTLKATSETAIVVCSTNFDSVRLAGTFSSNSRRMVFWKPVNEQGPRG